MYAAYDALPEHLRHEIEGLRAVHSARHIFGSKPREEIQASDTRGGRVGNAAADVLEDVVHPLVIIHPLSGRQAIYVNPAFTIGIAGWENEAAQQLLGQIYEHCLDPAFTHEFVWKPGAIALWDNRATWHLARNDYHGHRREHHRITIAGEALH